MINSISNHDNIEKRCDVSTTLSKPLSKNVRV